MISGYDIENKAQKYKDKFDVIPDEKIRALAIFYFSLSLTEKVIMLCSEMKKDTDYIMLEDKEMDIDKFVRSAVCAIEEYKDFIVIVERNLRGDSDIMVGYPWINGSISGALKGALSVDFNMELQSLIAVSVDNALKFNKNPDIQLCIQF